MKCVFLYVYYVHPNDRYAKHTITTLEHSHTRISVGVVFHETSKIIDIPLDLCLVHIKINLLINDIIELSNNDTVHVHDSNSNLNYS